MRRRAKDINKMIMILKQHIRNNLKEYAIISILFLIGITIGVILLNYSKTETKEEVSLFINNYISNIKSEDYIINTVKLIKDIMFRNSVFTIIMWFFGCTLLSIPITYGMITYKGFCLGVTISTIIYSLGIAKGILFTFLSLFLQNLLIVPSIFIIAVSNKKIYCSIVKNKNGELKSQLIRHTLYLIGTLLLLIIAAIVEVYISNNLLKLFANCL